MTTHRRGGCFFSILVVCFTLSGAVAVGDGSQQVRASAEDERITITVDGKVFTIYSFNAQHKYPFLYPVNGPLSGESVTTWNTEPFPHHSSLFFACDKVNGANYWQTLKDLQTGRIRTEGAEIAENGPDRVVLLSEHVWQAPNRDPDFIDRRRIVVTAPSALRRQIDFEIRLEPLRDVRIERNNHSLFAARMAPDLAVSGGGHLVNAEGKDGEKATFAQPSAWMAGYGKRTAGVEGLAIFPHPGNRWHPAPWFTRNYGFFSPTPIQWLPDGHVTLPKGEVLTLRYRVLIFAGDPQAAGLAEHYDAYVAENL